MKRIINGLKRRLYEFLNINPVNIPIHQYPIEKLGNTEYGSWWIPKDIAKKGAVCYCAGVGEDISFDMELVSRGCKVYSFDPTPRAIKYVAEHGKGFTFLPVGIWSKDEVQKFYVPRSEKYVSHSITNVANTEDYFEAECRSVKSLMQELGHDHIDILKLDVEGAEYEVIYSILKDNLNVKVICVEMNDMFAPKDADWIWRMRKLFSSLVDHGYTLVNYDKKEYGFTFIKLRN